MPNCDNHFLVLPGRFAAKDAGLYSFGIYARSGGQNADNGEFRVMKSDGTVVCVAWLSGNGMLILLSLNILDQSKP